MARAATLDGHHRHACVALAVGSAWRAAPTLGTRLRGAAAPLGGGTDLAWLGRNRRLSKDYDALPQSIEAWCYLAMSLLMSLRLTGRNRPERRHVRLPAAAA